MGNSRSVDVDSKKRNEGNRGVWPRPASAAAKRATEHAKSPTALVGGKFGKEKAKVYAAGREWRRDVV